MASCDYPTDLVHRIAYPTAPRPGLRSDSRLAASPAKDKHLPAPSSQQEVQELEDTLFREVEAGAKLGSNPYAAIGSPAALSCLLLALMLIPLFFTDPLPKREMLTMLYLQPPAAAASTATTIQAPASRIAPASISTRHALPMIQEAQPSSAPVPVGTSGGVVGGVPGGVVGGISDGVLSEVVSSSHAVPVPAKAPDPMPVKRVRVPARIAEANLIHDVAPKYPTEAGRERIEGAVVLLAVIGKDGSIRDVQVESGLPILAQAAMDAVRQWRYKPYLLNGEPVEVASRITINFTLSRG